MAGSYDREIFDGENPYTVGIELELRLLDMDTLLPANRSPVIFDSLPENLSPYVHKELLQSMIEVVTPVCKDATDAVDFISDALTEIVSICRRNGIYLAALATHPFEKKEDNERFHDPRYEAFAIELQSILKNFLISGLHIHVAMPDEKSAIEAYNASIEYLPIFLALSANSPYNQGEDTGLDSYRSEIFERLPRAGIPQYFDSYEKYCSLIDRLRETGTIESIKDVWWDVRIHQKFGTIELRVCDAFYDRERLTLIALFYRSLLEYASRHGSHERYQQINKQNKWNAVRHGLDGKFIDGCRVLTIREKAHELVDAIDSDGIFARQGYPEGADSLHELIEKRSIADKLREIYSESGDFRKVIEEEVIG